MRLRKHFIPVFSAAVVMTTAKWPRAAETDCPSSDDVRYQTQVGETWVSLAGRSYCRNGAHDRTQAALALHEYNRGRVGSDIGFLPEGVKVCLPKHLHRSFFDAEICEAAAKPPDGRVASVCGNGVREENELCDGTDLGGVNCATLGLPAGVLACRSDCHRLDASACVSPQSAPEIPPAPAPAPAPAPVPSGGGNDVRDNPMRLALGVDGAAGVMFSMATPGTATIYGTIGLARLGARLDVGNVQVLPHAIVGAGGGTTLLYGHDADLTVAIAGGGLQVGYPIAVRFGRVTPGVELQRMWMLHTTDARAPYGPVHFERSGGGATLVGAFLRSDFRFQRFPRLEAFVEFAFGYIPGHVDGFDSSKQIQLKTLSGVSYHAF